MAQWKNLDWNKSDTIVFVVWSHTWVLWLAGSLEERVIRGLLKFSIAALLEFLCHLKVLL